MATATAVEETRECSSCGEAKPLSTYKLRMSGKPRRQCRRCLNAKRAERRVAKARGNAWLAAHSNNTSAFLERNPLYVGRLLEAVEAGS